MVRLQRQRAGEEIGRPLPLPPLAVQVREIVGPAHDARRQPVRVQQRGLGPFAIVGGHQDQAELAPGVAQRRRRRVGVRGRARHRGVPPAHLRLHRRRQPRQVRLVHRPRPRPVERARAGRRRTLRAGRSGAAARHRESDRDQQPAGRRESPCPAPRSVRRRWHRRDGREVFATPGTTNHARGETRSHRRGGREVFAADSGKKARRSSRRHPRHGRPSPCTRML